MKNTLIVKTGRSFFLGAWLLLVIAGSCSSPLSEAVEKMKLNGVTSFGFASTDNPDILNADFYGTPVEEGDGLSIELHVPAETDLINLIPAWESLAWKVFVGEQEQTSGVSRQDFSTLVTYSFVSAYGNKMDLSVYVVRDPVEIPLDTTPPQAVTAFTATAGGEEATLTWTAPVDADRDHFVLSWTDGTTPGSVTIEDPEATSYTVTELTTDVEYTFTLVCVDAADNESSGLTDTAIPAILVLNVQSVGTYAYSGSIELNWGNQTDANRIGFLIQWTPPHGDDAGEVELTDPSSDYYYISGLTDQVEYTFTIYATAADDVKSSGVEVIETAGYPPMVSNLTATPGDGYIDFSWDNDTGTSPVGQYIKWTPGQETQFYYPEYESSFRLSGIEAGTDYTFSVIGETEMSGTEDPVSVTSTPTTSNVSFTDTNVESAVRTAISKPSGQILTSDLDVLTTLDLSAFEVSDLGGLEYCDSLIELNLDDEEGEDNTFTDLSALSYLFDLESLDLAYNGLTSLDGLDYLFAVTSLDLRYNDPENLWPISEWNNLEYVYLEDLSTIEEYIFGNFTSLKTFYARNCTIDSITFLDDLSTLEVLDLEGNPGITNIDLIAGYDLRNTLTELNIIDCGVDSTELETIMTDMYSTLEKLSYGETDGSLTESSLYSGSNFTHMTCHHIPSLSGDYLSMISPNLIEFSIISCDVTDENLMSWEFGTKLESLTITGNDLFTSAAGDNFYCYGDSLSFLDLSDNSINDFSRVLDYNLLEELDLSGNKITDIYGGEAASALIPANLPNLIRVDLGGQENFQYDTSGADQYGTQAEQNGWVINQLEAGGVTVIY